MLALAASTGLAAALLTVSFWHRPTPQVRWIVKRVPAPATDVQPLSEHTAHVLLPKMVANQLGRQEERNLMWHMLVCPPCFEHYAELKGLNRQHTVEADPDEHLVLVRR